MNLYKAILKQYGKAVSGGIGSFSQMGFTEAEIAVHALESITSGSYTVADVNTAFKAVKDYNTGMLCQLWTYGSYSMHIPNNEDYTVTPDNGKMATPRLHADLLGRPADRAVPASQAGHDAPYDGARTMRRDNGTVTGSALMPGWQDFAIPGERPGPGRGVRPVRGGACRPVPRHGRPLPAFGAVGAMGALLTWSIVQAGAPAGWAGSSASWPRR